MPSRRSFAFLLLVLVAMTALAPLVLAADCDEGCAPSCGDCVGCGVVADRTSVPVLVARLTSGALAPSARPLLPGSFPRQLDHVPLDAAA